MGPGPTYSSAHSVNSLAKNFFISALCRFWLPFLLPLLVAASGCRFWLPLLVAVCQKRTPHNIVFAGDVNFLSQGGRAFAQVEGQ
jgi:hypothetical protein